MFAFARGVLENRRRSRSLLETNSVARPPDRCVELTQMDEHSDGECMRTTSIAVLLVLASQCVNSVAAAPQLSDETVYRGMCDASAAIAVAPDLFVVACDEDNILRVYRRGNAEPVSQTDLTEFLEIKPDNPEADLEGAARIG